MWLQEPANVILQHSTQTNFSGLAGYGIPSRILWPLTFELQCNALAHHSDTVDGIDNSVDIVLL
jgi:hypothetical protein